MAPPPVPGPSTWDAFEPPSETSHLPPPPAYTKYATVSSSVPSPLPNSRVGGSHTTRARFTADIAEPGIAEPTREAVVEIFSGPLERQLLRHVSPYVEEFLDRIGVHERASRGLQATSKHYYRADLYLVPGDAVPAGEEWQLSGADYLKQGCNHLELTRVAAITPTKWDEKNHQHQQQESPRQVKCACGCVSPSSDEKRQQSTGQHAIITNAPSCDSSSAGSPRTADASSEVSKDLWWRDETQARWLAGYLGTQILQPSHQSSTLSHHVDKSPHVGNDKTCGCACHRSDINITNSRLRRLAEAVEASVRAEEMTFRRESEMGLWESKSGWTIIVSTITRS